MNKKEILIILLMICFVCSLQAVAAADGSNATDVVKATHTDVVGSTDVSAYSLPDSNQILRGSENAGTFTDLQNNLTGKTEVTLKNNFTYDSSKDSGLVNGITISDSITIDGQGKVIIDANKQDRVFNIARGATVTLKGITFINGNANGNGGSIVSAGKLTLENCNFINNTASGHGGAVYLGSSDGDKITNCNFEGNVAGSNGGAVDWYAGSSNGEVLGSNFKNNTAKRSGGAIHWSGHNGTISNTNFTGNKATGEVISDIGGVLGGGDGGAVLWVGSHGIIKDNCNFINNFAQYRGGAIFLHGNSTENCTNTTVTNCNFEDNIAGLNGGAIDWQRGANNGTLSYSNFTNNTAWRSGGAVYWYGNDGNITWCRFEDNHAIGNVSEHNKGVATYTTNGGNGGAIIWTGALGRVNYSNFVDNTAKNNGGAIYLTGSSDGLCENTTFDNCYFGSNEAGLNGGAIDWYRGAFNGTITNSIFENNIANRSGGAIHWSGYYGTVSNSNFTGNKATGEVISDIGGVLGGGDGGAVIWVGSHGIIKDKCNFINNFAKYRGGAVFLHGNDTENCTNTTVTNCNFEDNVAGLNGGAIDWQHGTTYGNLTYSNFTNNTAWRSGGAVYWNGLYGDILYCRFDDNHAIGNVTAHDRPDVAVYSNEGGHGGAVIWTGSHGEVYYSNFVNNTAKNNGGAVYLQSGTYGECQNTTFDNCYFGENEAGLNGGAVDWFRGASLGKVLNSVFENNIANRSGGAIHWSGHYGTISNSNFTGNNATGEVISDIGGVLGGGDGGAVIWVGSHGIINDNSNFINNYAKNRGGAIFLHGNSTEDCVNTTVVNSNFEDNVAGTNGGAIDWYEGAHDGTVENVTFKNNTAHRNGGAIFWNGHNGTIKHSRFINNRATGEHWEYTLPINMGNTIVRQDDGTLILGDIIVLQNSSMPLDPSPYKDKLVVFNYTYNNLLHFHSYVVVSNGAGKYSWKELDSIDINTSESIISPVDWAIDQYFGGDGGTILWSGDLGYVYNCTFIDSNSARRGGGAYMTGSDYVTFESCNFTNCTSGTNGGGVDWLAGANYGKIYNCIFNGTQAARSAGAIYYDGWYGDMQNITIINTKSNGGNSSFRTSKDGLVKYAGWDSSHWDTNTTGGDAGAIMFTGSNIVVHNVTFTNCVANGRGGAVFLQDNHNVTFDLCTFENNKALGIANNTWNDDKNLTTDLNVWHTGHGGAIAFDEGASDGVIKNSKFINNTAARDGGAIAFVRDSANGIIYNSLFINNTAYRSGGAFYWDGDGGNISYCNFTGNKALGIAIDYHHVDVTSLDQVINVSELPPASIDTDDYLYVLEIYNGTKIVKYELYVSIYNVEKHRHIWLKLDETTEVSPSPTDWAIDQYFGGDGGSILWTGDNGVIDHCIFLNSDSARRGGGAYMTGGDHVYYTNCTFENCTSGTNGGGLDWLAGANYGKVIDCNFTHTEAARSAGAIYYDGDYGEFRNIIIKDTYAHGGDLEASKDGKVKYAGWDSSHWDTNTTGGDAGAIMITGDHLNVYNVTFTNCTAVGRGGAIFLQDNFNATFDLCVFENNRALGTANNTYNNDNDTSSGLNRELTGDGGAIGFDTGATFGIIKDSKFINNTAARDGGAISYAEGSSNTTMYNVSFVNNTAFNDGGAIFWQGHYGIINASIFENNKAIGLGNSALISTTVNPNTNKTENRYNITGGDGGAIKWLGSHGIVINTTFYRNSASYNGGSIYLTGTATENCTNVTFIDCDFTENLAKLNGGAVFWASGASNANVKGSHFINNTALRSAGAIYVNGNYLEIKDTDFIDNGAKCTQSYDNRTGSSYFTSVGGNAGAICWMGSYGTVDNGTFINNTANGRGGAIQFERNREGIVKNSLFENNSANDDGGAIDWYLGAINGQLINSTFKSNYIIGNNGSGAGVFIEGYNATIKDSRFYDHYTNSDGGAVFVAGDECKIFDSTFERNSVGDDGGAIYWEGDYGTIENITCHDNHGISYNTSTSRGGAVSLIGSNITITKSKFTYNNVSYSEGANMSKLDGGAILITGSNITISDTEFSHNYALNYGGTIFILGNETIVENCTFDNTNATRGGAIYVEGHNATISAAFKNTNATLSGGAIYVNGENATIVNSSFDSTYAFGSVNNGGGAIMVNGNFTSIEKSNFTNTHADNNHEARGGAIYIKGIATNITDSKFEHSRSNRYGGSIYINGTNTTIRGSNFTDCTVNSEGSQGGAIYVEGKYTSIIGAGFDQNIAKDEGGAIYIHGENTTISNSTFENNGVDGNGGGAIYVSGDSTTIEGSNFTNNEAKVKDGAKGGAIYVEGKYASIVGSGFNQNIAKDEGGAIYIHGENTAISNSTFEKNNVNGDGGGAIYVSGDNVAIEGSNFTNNEAKVKDGAKGGAIYVEGKNTAIEGSNFVNSLAKFSGGAIYIDGKNAKVKDSNFTNSSIIGVIYAGVVPRGGAIYIKADDAVVEGSIFNYSSVQDADTIKGEGGAIFIEGDDARIVGSEFDSSRAYDGGAIYLKKAQRCNVSDSTFWNSYAAYRGGAMYSTGSYSTVYNSNFTYNLAELSGGAIYWYGGSSATDKSQYNTVDGCIFTNNTAHGNITNDQAITRGGGAIYWSENGEYGKILNSEFYYNSVQSTIDWKVDGGAVLWDKSKHALVDTCIFVGNFVTTEGDDIGDKGAKSVWAQGGAMYLRPNANYTVRNCHFENCSSSKEAGALYIQGKVGSSDFMIKLEDSVFINNVAQAKGKNNINGGGAIQIKQCPNSNFTNLIFINNTANTGGALSVFTSVSNLIIDGANFTSNKAVNGSAIYSTSGYTLKNAVLLENRANTSSLDLDFNRFTDSLNLTLKGRDNRLNSMYVSGGSVTCKNVTYWTNNNKTTGKKENIKSGSQSAATNPIALEKGISITVELFNGYNEKVSEGIFATDANGEIHLTHADFAGISSFNEVYVVARLTNEDYYTQVKVTTRLPTEMEATAHNVTYHRNATVNVTMTPSSQSEGNATGIISVYYNDTFLGNITLANNNTGISDKISTLLDDRYLEVGKHNLTLRYWGDLYNDAINLTVPINVTKAQSNITIIYDDLGYDLLVNVTIVDDFDDIYYKDATGNVVIEVYSKVSSTPLKIATVALINGTALTKIENLLPSNYTIKAHYGGDHNYYASVNSTPAEVREKADAIVDIQVSAYDIMVNETVYINITLITPDGYNATGNVTLYLDNEKYILPLNDSKAYFNKTGLTVGNKTVIVCYDGNEQLIPTSNDATFWVHKYNTTISVNTTNITHIQHEVINITLINETVGVVSVFVNNDEYFARINNGTAIVELPLLPVGDYNVTVIFSGDDKYNSNTTYAKFSVLPATPDILIDVENVTYGNSTTIVVTLINCAEGTVSIEIDGTPYDLPKPLNNGRVKFIVSDLAAGNYMVNATYSGDVNHTAVSVEKKFTVYKANSTVTVDVQDIVYGGVEDIKVYVNAAGTVTINLNGKTIEKDKVLDANNSTQVTVANLAANVYDIEVIYNGNENYTKSKATATFTVFPMDTTLDISVHNVVVWNDEYITVTVKNSTGGVATNLNGTLTINIDGVNHAAKIINGTTKFNFTENRVGHRVVWVFFDGNRNFTQSKGMKTYEVTQRMPSMEVIAQNITVGQDGNITVKLPANATGYVEIMVIGDGTYYSHVSNGQAVVYPKNLKEGGYSVDVRYHGDQYDNYRSVLVESYFTVSKAKVNVTIDVNDTVYGNASDIVVYVDDGVEGSITIRINDNLIGNYTIVDGKVNVTVKLDAGSYTVHAEYNGNYKYSVNKTESKHFTVVKATPVININTPDAIDAATNATIIVRINETATGNITITVNGTKYNATIENGFATFTIDQLIAGQYDITAEYDGDGNYTAATPVTLQNGLEVTKVSCYQINVTANDTKVDLNTTIIVKVPADATGNVSIYVDGVFVGNATISQGIAQWNVIRPYGNHTINATFTDGKYGPRYAVWDYWVFKHESPVSIDVNSIIVGDKAYVNVTAPSDNVTIEINGKSYTRVKYENGIAYFEVSGMEHGNKTVVAIYGGSDKYVQNTTTANFTVSKRDSFINVNVTNSTVGSGAFINVTVPSDAVGYVIVTVDNTNYTINLTGGKGNVTVYNLENNTYNVVVTYIGDEKYLSSTNSTKLGIDKSATSFEVNGTNITVGLAELITIETPDNITGPVKVEINDKNYTAFIHEGKGNLTVYDLSAGEYNVTVYFEGNNRYLPAVSPKNNFTVSKTTTGIVIVPQNITYGENETIIIYIDATGTVNVTVDTYEVLNKEIQGGTVIVEVPGFMTAGNYTVRVDYNGNANYTSSSAEENFTVAKADPVMTVDVQNITYGGVEYIIVNVKSSGNVTIKVNGTETTIVLKEGQGGKAILRAIVNAIEQFNGKATLEVHNLNAGEYPVEVTYNGNDNYKKATLKTTFFVTKDNVTVDVEVENIRVDGKEVINVTFTNTNVTGKVIINVDGKNYTRDISQGKANLTLDKLSNATHSVVVIYEGDRNFNGNWTSATFDVSKVKPAISVDVSNKTVGQTERIIVHLPDNATGYVVIDVDGKKYHVDIVKGQETALEIDNLENKTYSVDVTYSGDGYYGNATASDSFNVSKAKAEISVKVENITLGDVAVVNITVTGDSTGNVTITIGNEFNKTVGINDGVISVDVPGLTVGDKTVVVTYNGDDKYLPNGNSTKFSVAKLNLTSNIQIVDNGNGTVTVILPQNATGNVTIYVDGKNFTGNVSDGIAVITLENITPGKHNLTAVYSGDGNFTNATVNGTVVIPKLDSPLSVDAANITVGDVAYINVTAPTGNVTIEINGKSYKSVSFNGGIARFVVENLAYGNKTIAVTYGGDANYTRNFTTANFTVSKRNSYVKVNVSDINVGDVAYINVTVPSNATGHVIVNVNGANYTVNLTGGIGSLSVEGLGNGTYNVIATYLGDDQYLSSINDTQTFGVNKVSSSINITISNFGVIGNGSDADITVKVPVDATGKVEITLAKEFESKTYTIYVNDGIGILHLETPEIGIYNVTAKYLGDGKYIGSENKSELDVYINGKELFVDTIPTTISENEIITVWAQGNHTRDNVTVIITDNAGNVILQQNITFTDYVGLLNGSSAKLQLDPLPAGDYTAYGRYLEIDGLKEIIHLGNNPFTVSKLNSTLAIKEIKNITVGENATIELILNPSAATGNISVFINGIEYNLTTSDLTLTIPNLGAGDYYVRAFYHGNQNYSESNALAVFKVSKVNPQITVNATNITVGEDVLIEITAPEDIALPVLVDVGGRGYYVNITAGKGQLYVPYLDSGNYTVVVRYTGDDKYNETQNATKFEVSKVPSTVNVTVENITVGDKAVIKVETPKDLYGNVTVSVDGKNYTVFVSGGEGTLVVSDLGVGPYTVDVTFNGSKKYKPSNNTATFNVNKVKTSESDIKVIDQGNGTVLVVVPNNATGNVTINVGDKQFNAIVVNGTATVELVDVAPGDYEVDVTYSGDDNYNATSTKANITAPKYDSSINITVGEIIAGENGTVVVTVGDNATGVVTVSVDGKNFTAEVINGIAVVMVGNLTAGPKTVVVEYSGDGNYTSGYAVGNFTVEPAMIDPDVSVVDYGNGTVVVVVGDNATGNVTVKVGDKEFNATVVNGTAVVELGNLTPGENTVEVIYSGDATHNSTVINATVTGPKYDSPFEVIIPEAKEGEPTYVTVKVPQNATGNVTVTVDGKNYTAKVVNGTAIVDVGNLTAGSKSVIVEYPGDNNYANNYTVFNFAVEEAKAVPDMKIIDQGNGTVMVVVGDNATGNVTITVDGKNYTAEVVNGTAVVELGNVTPGTHEVEVIYSGDSTHNATVTNANVTAPKYDSPFEVIIPEIEEGVPANITVKVPENATGVVTVSVDGKSYNATVVDGVAVVEVGNLTAGPKTVVVEYSGDDNYTSGYAVGNFTVEPAMIVPDVSVVDYGNGTVVVVVGDNATGNVTVKVGDKEFNATVVNGTAIIELGNVTPGTHEVEVIYSGDATHNSTVVNATVVGPKYDSPFEVIIPEAKEGEPTYVTVKVPQNATGNVTVTVDGKNYTAEVVNGTAIVDVGNLTAGSKSVIVEYPGDNNYANNYTVFNFAVEEAKAVPDMKIIDQGNGTVVVVVGDNATGNVTITVDGKNYTAEVVNGTAVVELGNVTPGTHEVEVIYSGDSTHNATVTNANVTAPKYDSPFEVIIPEVKEGEPVNITVKVPENATGVVTVSVDGKSYNAAVVDGVAVVEVGNLTAGPKTVVVEYSGDDNYTSGYAVGNFTVEPAKVVPDVSVVDYGNGTVVVIVGDNATGNVTVTIDGKNYTAEVVNGSAVVELDNVAPGTHEIEVIYSGDGTHNATTTKANVTAPKYDSPINVTVGEIKSGENGTVVVELPEDATGNVTVSVDGKSYTAEVVNGTAVVMVGNLTAGPKTVVVEYSGDGNYTSGYAVGNFTVEQSPVVPEFTVIDQGNGTVVVVVPEDAKGNVTVSVDGKSYTAEVVNGTAVIELGDVAPGTHEVEVVYSGDDKYANVTKTETITAPKYDSPINVTVGEIKSGENGTVVVELPEDATGVVTVSVDGKTYTAEVVNGTAVVMVGNLTAGPKTVVVEYSGDGNYSSGYAVGNFTVEQSPVVPEFAVIDQGNGTVVVVVPEDAKGNVTVSVDGKSYTAEVVNGTAVIELGDVAPGTHEVEVVYSGDDKYANVTKTETITAPKYDSPINVTVGEIKSGENGTVVVELPEDATGVVTVSVDGKTYTAEVVNGTAVVRVGNLTAGPKTVVVEYSGDGNYTSGYAVGNFTVEQSKVDPDVTVVNQGNGTIVVVVPKDAKGNVTVKVGDNTYNATVINGTATLTLDSLTPGENNIEVIYGGDDKYSNATFSSIVTGPKYDAPIEIITVPGGVGEDTVITVKVPENATGNATVEIDGVKYTSEIINGSAIFRINNLTAGTKTIAVGYDGDDNYAGKHTVTNVTVSKVKSTVSATVTDINVGENVTLTVFVPEDATSQVLIDIDGVGYYVNVTKGMGTIQIPRMPNGIYPVNVTYVGDDKYLPSNNCTEFDVNKIPSYVIPKATNIMVGENEIIVFEVPSDATGNLTVVINGEKFTFDIDEILGVPFYDVGKFSVAVSDGKGVLVLSGLPMGIYDVTVTYNGNYKYLKSSNSTIFTVTEKESEVNVVDLGNGTIKVFVSDNATGNVTVKVANQTYVADVIDGVAVINLDNVPAGDHDVEVIYSGDNKHAPKTVDSKVSIPKKQTPISVDTQDIFVGNKEHIVVTVSKDATGIVSIEIDAIQYDATIKDGKAVFDVSGLTAGSKTVAVTYWGDANHDATFTTGQFEVIKRTSTVDAVSKDITVGKDETIKITFPKDATGRVTVTIDGVDYSGEIINGKVNIVIPNLPAGKYEAIITYEGDDKYLSSTTKTKFEVRKNSAPVSANDDYIKIGDDGTVVVNLPSDATGTVTIIVNGHKYTMPVIDGKAEFKIPGLKKGDHDVIVFYSGDDKYAANETVTKIVVFDDNNETHNETHESAARDFKDKNGISLSAYPTANPILVLMIMILAMGTIQLRRFKK